MQSIVLGGEVGGEVYAGLWSWGKGADGGVRLVVFGDAGVDNSVKGGEKVGSGKGKSWTEVLCDEVSLLCFLCWGVGLGWLGMGRVISDRDRLTAPRV